MHKLWQGILFFLFLLVTLPLVRAAQPPVRLVTQDYPPYIYTTNGRAEGPLVDVITEAFRRSNTPVTIEVLPWSRALTMATEGTADGLFSIKKTRDREAVFLYPNQALFSQDYVFFVRANSHIQFDGNLSAMGNLRMGVVTNTSYGARFDDAVKLGVFKNIQTAYDYEHIFRMLQENRVDIVICSRLVGLGFARKVSTQDGIVISGPPVETTYSFLVFTQKKDTRTLSANFDQAIDSMRRDGTLSHILDQIAR